MGIGSFLSKAGYIGAEAEDFVNKREVQRAARAEAQARQLEMARQEQRRLDRMAMPDITDQVPTYDIGAPGSVAAGQFGVPPVAAGVTPVSVPVPAGVKPAPAPAPVAGVKPLVKTAAAPPKAKAGLESGVGGFRAYGPEESDFSRARTAEANTARLNDILASLTLKTDVRGAWLQKPFASQSGKADITVREAASDWYASAAAKKYFRDYPQALEIAQTNPVGFYKSLQEKNAQRDAAAKTAAPKAAAPATQAAAFDTTSFLNRVKAVESGGNYNTPNLAGTSTAFGAYQITKDTWVGTYKKLNPRSGMSDAQIWNLRRDPAAQDQVAGALAQTNASILRNAGLPVNDTSMYLSWFLGGNGAVKLLSADDNTPVSRVVSPAQMQANKTILEGRTVGDVINWADGKMSGRQAGAAPTGTGVQESAAARQPQEPLAASDFYLAQPSMISRDTSNAVQMRQLLVQRANEFKKFGMINEFDQARAELINVDNNIRMLQGLQGITELETARDPRRLSAVWSDYAGTPIQIQPRTDGRFDIVVNGRVTSRGVDGAQIRDVARSTFDKAYLQQRVESSTAITMEQIKSQLKIDEATAAAVIGAVKDIQVAQINGQAGVARQLALNAQARIAATPGGRDWLLQGGTVQQLVADYTPPGAPEGVPPGPVALPVSGMPAGVRSVGVS